MHMKPYSFAYANLPDAVQNNQPYASMINRAGQVVEPNALSMQSAVLELGGNLDERMRASLVDGHSHNSWPIVGYAYFALRTDTHLGDCSRRRAAMEAVFGAFYSAEMQAATTRLGTSILPDFIRDVVVSALVESVKCSDGSLALSQHHVVGEAMGVPKAMDSIWDLYMDSYGMVDQSIKWDTQLVSVSSVLWSRFIATPDSYVGTFSISITPEEREQRLTVPHITSVQFLHMSMAVLYNLQAFSSRAGEPLRLTKDIIAGIFCGAIRYWNDSKIQAANDEHRQYLPFQRITVVTRNTVADGTGTLIQYLTSGQPTEYDSVYTAALASHGNDVRDFPFAAVIVSDHHWVAASYEKLDSAVSYVDGSIGYFRLSESPRSAIASFCHVWNCSGPVVRPDDGGESIQ